MKWFKNFIVKLFGGIKVISKKDLISLIESGSTWIDRLDVDKNGYIDIKEIYDYIKGKK